MTKQENLNDIMNKRILKTKMYSFEEVRDMFELERQRLKEEIELLYVANAEQLNFKSKVMIILGGKNER